MATPKSESVDGIIVDGTELAAWIGVTSMRVSQLVTEGVISRISRREYDLKSCVQSYCDFARRGSRGSESAKDEQAERTRLTAAKADLAELERERRVGELMLTEVVRRQDFTIARVLRNNLQSIADRVSTMVAAESDPAKVHDLINAEVTQSLESAINAMAAEEVDDATLDITRRTAAEQLAESTAAEDIDHE